MASSESAFTSNPIPVSTSYSHSINSPIVDAVHDKVQHHLSSLQQHGRDDQLRHTNFNRPASLLGRLPHQTHPHLFSAHVAHLRALRASQLRSLRSQLAELRSDRMLAPGDAGDSSESVNRIANIHADDGIMLSSASALNLSSKLTRESAFESLATLFFRVEYSVLFHTSERNNVDTSNPCSHPNSVAFVTLTRNPPPALLSAARANALFNNYNPVRVSRDAIEMAHCLPSQQSLSVFPLEPTNNVRPRFEDDSQSSNSPFQNLLPVARPSASRLNFRQTAPTSSFQQRTWYTRGRTSFNERFAPAALWISDLPSSPSAQLPRKSSNHFLDIHVEPCVDADSSQWVYTIPLGENGYPRYARHFYKTKSCDSGANVRTVSHPRMKLMGSEPETADHYVSRVFPSRLMQRRTSYPFRRTGSSSPHRPITQYCHDSDSQTHSVDVVPASIARRIALRFLSHHARLSINHDIHALLSSPRGRFFQPADLQSCRSHPPQTLRLCLSRHSPSMGACTDRVVPDG